MVDLKLKWEASITGFVGNGTYGNLVRTKGEPEQR